MKTEIILHTQNLSKRYQKRWAVKDLDLEVHKGDIFGFLGPNGAGKSTTIRMILSLVKPTQGSIHLFGHSLFANRNDALKSVGGIVENPDFYGYLSAFRNLEIVGALYGGVKKSRIGEVLELVGLEDRARDKVKAYSHGMKQRLGIAQALLSDPELVVLDEPTSGLDPQGMKEVRDLILHLAHQRGKTIFLSSHLLHEIEMVANRMAIINRGTLVIQGDVREILEEGEKYIHLVATPRKKVEAILRSRESRVRSFSPDHNGWKVVIQFEDVSHLNRLLVSKGIEVQAIVPRRSLEDFFLSITEGNGSGSSASWIGRGENQ